MKRQFVVYPARGAGISGWQLFNVRFGKNPKIGLKDIVSGEVCVISRKSLEGMLKDGKLKMRIDES